MHYASSEIKDRVLPFEGIENARQLGGIAVQGGRTVRHGCLIRSGNLSKASDGDVKLLKEVFRLTDVFDFRFGREAAAEPDREIDGVHQTPLPTLPQAFIDGFSSGRADTEQVKSADFTEALARYAFVPQAQELARRLYPAIVMDPDSQRRYGAFLKGVLAAEGGALWHCSQGKDRAGWGTAFLLAALGADRKTIVEDFAYSNIPYAPAVEALCSRVAAMGGGEAEQNFIRSMVGVSVENFETALDLIDARFGSMNAYLTGPLCLRQEDIESLKNKYLQ